MITPTLVRPETMEGTGYLEAHDDVYHLERDDLYLVGTSEVALAGYHAEEILTSRQAPPLCRLVDLLSARGWFARQRHPGIIRVHQFNKLEMFVYCSAEDSKAEHERLLAWEEQMLGKLELPYRVIDTAAGTWVFLRPGSSTARRGFRPSPPTGN